MHTLINSVTEEELYLRERCACIFFWVVYINFIEVYFLTRCVFIKLFKGVLCQWFKGQWYCSFCACAILGCHMVLTGSLRVPKVSTIYAIDSTSFHVGKKPRLKLWRNTDGISRVLLFPVSNPHLLYMYLCWYYPGCGGIRLIQPKAPSTTL